MIKLIQLKHTKKSTEQHGAWVGSIPTCSQ